MMILRPTRREAITYGAAASALALGAGSIAKAQPKRCGVPRVAKGYGGATDSLDRANYEDGSMPGHAFNSHSSHQRTAPRAGRDAA